MGKENSVVVFNPWEIVSAGAISNSGLSANIEDSYINTLQMELVALTSLSFSDNIELIVEYSGDGSNWVGSTALSVLLNNNDSTTLLGDVTAGDFSVPLVAAFSLFSAPGSVWFIQDSTIANSESVRTETESLDIVQVSAPDGIINNHATASNAYANVKQWSLFVPASVKFVRALCNNLDTTYSVAFTARILKTTSLT